MDTPNNVVEAAPTVGNTNTLLPISPEQNFEVANNNRAFQGDKVYMRSGAVYQVTVDGPWVKVKDSDK